MWVGCREWGVGGRYRAVVGAEVLIIIMVDIIIIININIMMILISWSVRERWRGTTG